MSEKRINDRGYVLNWGDCLGTKAIDAYTQCCRRFHWDITQRHQFAPMQYLYAKNVTPEGYGVFMLVHTDLNERYNERFSWFTYVKGDILEQIWFISNKTFRDDPCPRVIFARTPNGYVFQGVYIFYDAEIRTINKKERLVQIYKRISPVYPVNEIIPVTPQVTRSPVIAPPKPPKRTELSSVIDNCKIKAYILESKKETVVTVEVGKRPFQKELIGKCEGDTFSPPNIGLTYRIDKIYIEE